MTRYRPDEGAILAIASRIRELKPSVEALIPRFRARIARIEDTQAVAIRKHSASYWVLAAYTDALIRLRLFMEQNLKYFESFGLLALTRYVVELVIWLKLMRHDDRYGLVYYHDLLAKQLNYHKDLRNQLTREVTFLRLVQDREEKLTKEATENAKRISEPEAKAERVERLWSDVSDAIDSEAARSFSMYFGQARRNGYGFEADLIETKALPPIIQAISQIEAERAVFDREVPSLTRALIPAKWNWRDLAKKVGMQDDYDFIYTYTSRLLHATAASLTTDKKNLEADEMCIFLSYINVRSRDIIDMANALLSGGSA